MSELINNARQKKDELKRLIRKLHEGTDPETVREELAVALGEVPYGFVVEVEQELIAEGLPPAETLKLCDIHGQVLKGMIDHTGAKIPDPGHPVHTFMMENRELETLCGTVKSRYRDFIEGQWDDRLSELVDAMLADCGTLMDVDTHYRRKENLVFPYLEKYGVTGPPTVMWGKHDEIRAQLKSAISSLHAARTAAREELAVVFTMFLLPAISGIEDMVYKEEQILFPMCLDTLNETEWSEIHHQSPEIGFCLFDPKDEWVPQGLVSETGSTTGDRVTLPSGSFSVAELTALLNTLPVDITFVDKDDAVRYFSQGKERIFDRNRSILGRKVQFCHPPHSVHIVNQIVSDFRAGTQDSAAFWITLGGKFIHIEYFALRDDKGEYLGTLEVSQNLTDKRALTGEQRLLSYEKKGDA